MTPKVSAVLGPYEDSVIDGLPVTQVQTDNRRSGASIRGNKLLIKWGKDAPEGGYARGKYLPKWVKWAKRNLGKKKERVQQKKEWSRTRVGGYSVYDLEGKEDVAKVLGKIERDIRPLLKEFGLSYQTLKESVAEGSLGFNRGRKILALNVRQTRNPMKLRKFSAVMATMIHEAAHLRHMNHGPQFKMFEVELREWARNHGIYAPATRVRRGYDQPASELSGYRTLVTNPDGTQPGGTQGEGNPHSVLPSPPFSRSKPTGTPSYNGPGPSGTGPGGKSVSIDRVRTRSTPGEDRPHPIPEASATPKRRELRGGFLINREPVEHTPGQWYGRADSKPGEEIQDKPDPTPGQEKPNVVIPTDTLVRPYPGAGRFSGDQDSKMRLAVRITDIQSRCGPDLVQRSQGIKVKLRRVDTRNQMWAFEVQGSKGPYKVRVKAKAAKNITSAQKANVYMACSCPFWRWQGPEHWAKSKGYLYGRPQGSASRPNIKDPNHKHGACKHVLAVLRHITENKWTLPGRHRRSSDLQYLADRVASSEVWAIAQVEPNPMILRVAQRYRRRVLRRTR